MSSRNICTRFIFIALILLTVMLMPSRDARAQESRPRLKQRTPDVKTPKQEPRETQETEKVLTEEVRLPVFARDNSGHFDPTLEPDDVLILEDNVAQDVKSVRRVPSNVLLLLDMSSWDNAAMRAWTTRKVAREIVDNLRAGDSIAVMQFAERVELVQSWTGDKTQVERALQTKLFSGRRARFSAAVVAAAKYIAERPVGNRHIVIISDGVETIDADKGRFEAAVSLKDLIAAQAVIHVISYTSLAREISKKGKKKVMNRTAPPPGSERASGIETVSIDPTLPPGVNRGGAINSTDGFSIGLDSAMKRRRKAYEQATLQSEHQLTALTQATGGQLYLPMTETEMVTQGRETALEIGVQYVVTYKPKRAISNLTKPEYRRLRVAARRVGLTLRAPEGYTTTAMSEDKK